MASAATACIVAVTWEYKSKVMPIWLWPSRSLTILGARLAQLQRGAAVAQVMEADAGAGQREQAAGRSSAAAGCVG
jgi:hypothetical protein